MLASANENLPNVVSILDWTKGSLKRVTAEVGLVAQASRLWGQVNRLQLASTGYLSVNSMHDSHNQRHRN